MQITEVQSLKEEVDRLCKISPLDTWNRKDKANITYIPQMLRDKFGQDRFDDSLDARCYLYTEDLTEGLSGQMQAQAEIVDTAAMQKTLDMLKELDHNRAPIWDASLGLDNARPLDSADMNEIIDSLNK